MSSELGRTNKDSIHFPKFGVEPTQTVSVRDVVTNPYPHCSRSYSIQFLSTKFSTLSMLSFQS